jgi:hypothetical protein
LLAAIGCGPNEAILKSNASSPPDTSGPEQTQRPVSTTEEEIAAMRTANFEYIYVVRRNDGGVLDRDDRSVIRDATAVVNRRTLSGDGRDLIIGSNQRIAAAEMRRLTERFRVEELSENRGQGTPATANANM